MSTTPQAKSKEAQAAIESAMQAVKTIDALAANEDFRRFMGRFTKRADELADEILHGEMKSKKREKLRNIRLGIMEVLLAPKEDREAQIRVLATYGISMGGDLQE